MAINPPLIIFKPLKLQVPASRLESAKGQPFEFGSGSRIVQELGSSRDKSKNPITQISTLRFVEVVEEVMQANKTVELFQTMAIVSLNIGNLNMEVKCLNNKLAREDKATLQKELDKERDFQKEYKHNIEIWRK